MITVVCPDETPESLAAGILANKIRDAWPRSITDESEIYLIPTVQCHGQNPKDIDIVLLARLEDGHVLRSTGFLTSSINREEVSVSKVNVESLCVVIEIKEHGPGAVRFEGNKVEVIYNNKWHDATRQSENQKYSLKRYLNKEGINSPRIINLIWLRCIDKDQIPSLVNNVLPSNFTWNKFLNLVAINSVIFPRGKKKDNWYLNSEIGDDREDTKRTIEILTRLTEPTVLDREHMDRMCNLPEECNLTKYLGKKQIILRGRGGTGKTMMMLQLAWNTCNKEDTRVLVLTYNKALVADLRRLMSLAGLTDDIARGTIHIQTVHSFIRTLLIALDILDEKESDYLDNFEKYKDDAIEYFKGRAISQDDVDEVISNNPNNLDWGCICIDEAQDWPKNERDLLRYIYPPTIHVIADGIDQLVRAQDNCDWSENIKDEDIYKLDLNKCLRLKRNLAKFVKLFIKQIGLKGWTIKENEDANGGNIIIVEGDYFKATGLHEKLVENCEQLGNFPVDVLACVPPSMARHRKGYEHSIIASKFQDLGQEIWDGTAEKFKDSYPTSVRQLRVVQYESCRGLEGWSVINLAFDEFYNLKLAQWEPSPEPEPGVMDDDLIMAKRFAARWAVIPLTRAIDTLIIEVGLKSSEIKSILKKMSGGQCKDYMEWIKTE